MTTSAVSTPAAGPALVARRGLAVYFAVLIPATAVVEVLVLRTGEAIGKDPLAASPRRPRTSWRRRRGS
ncbi:MAG TPA: hypothetical protein VJA16_19280 [Thermoanaerobaculia bacterium]